MLESRPRARACAFNRELKHFWWTMPKKFAEDTRGAKAKEQKSKAAADRSAADEAARKAAEDEEWAAGANALALKK